LRELASDSLIVEGGGTSFSAAVLQIDAEATCRQIGAAIERQVLGTLRRRGVVVGLSGGVDSSVCAALSVRALGSSRVLGLLMPDRDSSPESERLAGAVASRLGISTNVEHIEPILAAAGCYARQADAIRAVFPDCDERWRWKIVLPSLLATDRLNISSLTVSDPTGRRRIARLPPASYRQLVAATNFKQRVRAMIAHYHADRLNYAVLGTPNRLEFDQGFFVKGGDGLADLKPIAHLYKTQVYSLARVLKIPEEICQRPPTSDTFSLPQTQEEFYFGVPCATLDVCLYAHRHRVGPDDVAGATGLTAEQVRRIYRDIEAKRRATAHLHRSPLLVEPVLDA
jgi:NAD+ synthase